MSSVHIVIATLETQMHIQYTVYFNGQQHQLISVKTLYLYNWLENDTRNFKSTMLANKIVHSKKDYFDVTQNCKSYYKPFLLSSLR